MIEAFPHAADAWPWPTVIANLIGAFALGYFATRLQERLPVRLPAAASRDRPLRGADHVFDQLGLRRRVPTVTVTIAAPDEGRRWFELLDDLTPDRGLVTAELVASSQR